MFFIPFSPQDKPIDDIKMPRTRSDYDLELYTNQPIRLVPLMPTEISLDIKMSFYTGSGNGRALMVTSHPKIAISDGIILIDSPRFFKNGDDIILNIMWTGANTSLNNFQVDPVNGDSILIPHASPIAIGYRYKLEHLHKSEEDISE